MIQILLYDIGTGLILMIGQVYSLLDKLGNNSDNGTVDSKYYGGRQLAECLLVW